MRCDMDLLFEGKNVFVTASSGGIGKAVAKGFLREGAAVIINGRSEERLHDTLREFQKEYGDDRVQAVCADMSDEISIRHAAESIKDYVGCIDAVVGNLGTGKPVYEDKFDLNEWRHMLSINLLSAVGLIGTMRGLFPKGGGSIALIGSLAAHDRIGAPPAYAAAKAGIVSLVKYAAPILSERNIRINAVSPGNVLFEGGRWEEILKNDEEGTKSYIEKEVPMKRFGMAGEIAETVLFLCSERSSFTTGAIIQVDGGQGRGY